MDPEIIQKFNDFQAKIDLLGKQQQNSLLTFLQMLNQVGLSFNRGIFKPFEPSGDRWTDPDIIRGPQGEPGQDAASITILGQINSIADLPVIGVLRDSYLLANDDDSVTPPAQSGDLFVWNNVDNVWVNIGNIRGPRGFTFVPNLAADGYLSWDQVITSIPITITPVNILPEFTASAHGLAPDAIPTADISNTAPGEWDIDFGLVKGDTGDLSEYDVDIIKDLTVSYTNGAVVLEQSKLNLKTMSQSNISELISPVTVSYAGVVDPEMFNQFNQNTQDIATLKSGLGGFARTATVVGLPQPPTDLDLTTAFNGAFPDNPAVPGDKILEYDINHLWLLGSGGHWIEIDNTATELATQTNPGTAKHSTADGTVGYYVAGIGQVNGFDALKNRVSILEGGNAMLLPAVSWSVTQIATNMSSVQLQITYGSGTINSGDTLTLTGQVNITPTLGTVAPTNTLARIFKIPNQVLEAGLTNVSFEVLISDIPYVAIVQTYSGIGTSVIIVNLQLFQKQRYIGQVSPTWSANPTTLFQYIRPFIYTMVDYSEQKLYILPGTGAGQWGSFTDLPTPVYASGTYGMEVTLKRASSNQVRVVIEYLSGTSLDWKWSRMYNYSTGTADPWKRVLTDVLANSWRTVNFTSGLPSGWSWSSAPTVKWNPALNKLYVGMQSMVSNTNPAAVLPDDSILISYTTDQDGLTVPPIRFFQEWQLSRDAGPANTTPSGIWQNAGYKSILLDMEGSIPGSVYIWGSGIFEVGT